VKHSEFHQEFQNFFTFSKPLNKCHTVACVWVILHRHTVNDRLQNTSCNLRKEKVISYVQEYQSSDDTTKLCAHRFHWRSVLTKRQLFFDCITICVCLDKRRSKARSSKVLTKSFAEKRKRKCVISLCKRASMQDRIHHATLSSDHCWLRSSNHWFQVWIMRFNKLHLMYSDDLIDATHCFYRFGPLHHTSSWSLCHIITNRCVRFDKRPKLM